MSEAITTAPVIVFAGAGASAHLGYPASACFLKVVDDAVSREYDDRSLERDNWHELRHNSKLDWEDIYEGLGDDKLGANPERKRLRLLIGEEMIQEFGKPPPRRVDQWQTQGCWGKFLSAIHPGEGHVVPLFTTNYDISFEYLRPELEQLHRIFVEDAFERSYPGAYPWTRKKLYIWRPAGDKQYVWLFRLHGCVAWERPRAPEQRAPAYLYFDRDGRPAAALPKADRAIVWPSKQKRPFKDPYWTEYRYFLRCLDNTKAIIFLGYGFNDDHIKVAVAEALEYNTDLEVIAISDVAGQKEFRSCLSPIRSASVNFVEGDFTPEGIEDLVQHKALRALV